MAKKNKEIAAENDASNIVLPNQIPVRYIAKVDKNDWVNLGGNLWEIPITQFTGHPDNQTIFKSNYKENVMLKNNIAASGVLVPIIANMRQDGELRVVSGHRRLSACEDLEVLSIRAEIVEISDEEELLFLFSTNVNRGLQDSAKIRYFKLVTQSLCQVLEDNENEGSYDEEELKKTPLVRIVPERGLMDFSGMKKKEVLSALTGLTVHEINTLVRVVDGKYRERTIEKIRGIKGMSKKADQLAEAWHNLEQNVLFGYISLTEADKEVVSLNKQIESALKGKVVKEKPLQKPKAVKEKAAPIVEEKPAFDMSNIDAILEAFSEIIYEEFCEDFNIEINGKDFDILSPKIKKFGLSLLKFMAEQK